LLIDRVGRGSRGAGPGRWVASCPAHEELSPSLSIRELEDGRVLLHDFAGCDLDTMAAFRNVALGSNAGYAVTFRYKQAYHDGSKPVQYVLVAEEVAEVSPKLVVYGKDGKPETVAYHVLVTLRLNELQKDHRVMQAQAHRIGSLERETAELAALKAQVATMAKIIERLDRQQMVASAR